MNNTDKLEEFLDEVYKNYVRYTIVGVNTGLDRVKGYLDNCLVEFDGYYEHFTNPSFIYGYSPYEKEEFINKIKTDKEFAERWGLKIEKRELSLEERSKIAHSNHYEVSQNIKMYTGFDEYEFAPTLHKNLDDNNIPTKAITITYNNQSIEVYE